MSGAAWVGAAMAVAFVGLQAYRVIRVNARPHLGDSFTYLCIAREMRRQRSLFPRLEYCYTEEPEVLQLPPLLMAMLVPAAWAPYAVAMSLPVVVDVMTAVLTAAAGHLVFGLNPDRAVLSGLVFLLTPINSIMTASLTPRGPALFWLTVFIAGSSMFVAGGGNFWLAVAAVAAMLAVMTQRMVTQILLLVAPVVGIGFALTGRVEHAGIVIALVLGLALAWVTTGGRYGQVIADHVRRILVHARTGQQQRLRREFGRPRHIVKANPWLLLLTASLLAGHGLAGELWMSMAFVVGMLVLAVVWVMGNSVNHVYFASPLVAWLLAATLPAGMAWQAAVAVVAVVCVVVVVREFRVTMKARISDEWMEAFRFITARGLTGRALVLPWVSFPALPYYTSLVIVSGGHGSKAMTFNRLHVRQNLAVPGFITGLVRQLAIRYVFVDTEVAGSEVTRSGSDLAGEEFRTVFANGRVTVLEAVPQAA